MTPLKVLVQPCCATDFSLHPPNAFGSLVLHQYLPLLTGNPNECRWWGLGFFQWWQEMQWDSECWCEKSCKPPSFTNSGKKLLRLPSMIAGGGAELRRGGPGRCEPWLPVRGGIAVAPAATFPPRALRRWPGRAATPRWVSVPSSHHQPKWRTNAEAQGTNETKKGRAMWTINSLLPIWTQILWCTDVPFFFFFILW